MKMNIQNNSQINFSGIKLSSSKFESVRDVAFYLKRSGFTNLGHKTVYCNNSPEAKFKAAADIRKRSGFFDKEFGAVFFPWSGEAYIMASPSYEQVMMRMLSQYDKHLVLNMLI